MFKNLQINEPSIYIPFTEYSDLDAEDRINRIGAIALEVFKTNGYSLELQVQA